jgi:hypothetical protein
MQVICSGSSSRRRGWGKVGIPRSQRDFQALPPVEYCRDTTPSHAAKSRPFRKAAPLPMATMAVNDRPDPWNLSDAGTTRIGGGDPFQLKAESFNLVFDMALGSQRSGIVRLVALSGAKLAINRLRHRSSRSSRRLPPVEVFPVRCQCLRPLHSHPRHHLTPIALARRLPADQPSRIRQSYGGAALRIEIQ